MNLTVGPLPPAVYWRRRAIILGGLLLAVVLVVSTCDGSGGKPGAGKNAAQSTPTSQAPAGTPSVLTPIIGVNGGGDGGDASTAPTTAGSAQSPADVADQPSPSGPCSDGDLSLTGLATPLAKGFYLSMKVKNTSGTACSRDLGGGPQALQVINAGGTVVWSSDACSAAGHSPAPDVRTFGPNIETVLPSHPFYWDGTLGKCSNGSAPPAGTYRLVARLGSKASTPLALVGK